MEKTAFSLGKRLLAISIVAVLVALTACGAPPAPSPTAPATKPPATTAPATTAPATSYPPYTPKPPEPATPTGPPLTGLPKISFDGVMTAPKASSASWVSSNVFCQADFTNMYIVKRSDKNVEGQGHVVFYMDMPPITTPGAKASVLPSPAPTGAKVFIVDAQDNIVLSGAIYTFTGVSNGNHTFAAQLVQNDDTPFNPPLVWKTVTVNVNKPAPSPTTK